MVSPSTRDIIILDRDDKKTLLKFQITLFDLNFNRAKLNTPDNSENINNELEIFSEDEFNFYKNKSFISIEDKKCNSRC